MSRAGAPTPIIEAINGWITLELHLDFHLQDLDIWIGVLERYIHDFNHIRPVRTLNYKRPTQFKAEPGFRFRSFLEIHFLLTTA